MLRRQLLSNEVINEHKHTPQYWRTFRYTSAFQPSLYRGGLHKRPRGSDNLSDEQKSWIGKLFVPAGYKPSREVLKSKKYVHESSIAHYAKPYIYRVLYLGTPSSVIPGIRNKVSIDYSPFRLNIILDNRDIIRYIEYF